MPATFPEIIKMFYNCGGERQTFACRLLTPINAGLPPSSEGLPLSCEGPPPSSVLLPPWCLVWRGTRKRRYRGGRPTLWDGRPTLWDGRATLCEGRPALRDAIGRHMLFLTPETVSEAWWCFFQSNAVSGNDSEWRCGPFYTLLHTTPSSGAVA